MPSKLQNFHKHSRICGCFNYFGGGRQAYGVYTDNWKAYIQCKKVVEHFVINSCKEGGKNLSEMTEVPTNMTELGVNIQVSGNSRSFEMRRPWKKDKNKGTLMRTN